ncbi:right-handed parallel beta-helix repeat-containing protein [Thalassoglobus sp. JC818]|uniref:right-handed parallel beta-helix repeat-containing protein n=1 Tax=Thalassoglobus sp. JC818 TaxID=3232136 RepID=UPI00345B19E4
MRFVHWGTFTLCMVLLGSAFVRSSEAQNASAELIVERADPGTFFDALERVSQLRKSGTKSPVVLEMQAGVYRLSETLVINSELVGDGLTFRGPKDDSATLTGAIELRSKTELGSGRWKFEVPDSAGNVDRLRAVLVDGELRPPARFPRTGSLRIAQSLPDRRSGFTVNEGDLPDGIDEDIEGCTLILLHDWSSSQLPIASYDPSTRTLKSVGPIGCSAAHYAIDHFEKQPRYWIEGHPKFADQPGDWAFDAASNSIVYIADENTPLPNIEVPNLEQLVVVQGEEDHPVRSLVFEGIHFTGTKFPMPAGGLAGAQATMHEPRDEQGERTTGNRPMLSAAVEISLANDCKFIDCDFAELGNTGLWLGSRTRNCRVTRCRFDSIGGNGLNLGEDRTRTVEGQSWINSAPEQVPTRNRVDHCEISHCGNVLPGAVAIWASFQRELLIEENNIHDCPYTGISLGWMWNESETPAAANVIRNNRIAFVMQTLSDGGGIYTLGRQPGSLLEGNNIHDVPLNAGRAESNGMFLDEGTTGFTIQGNTIRRIDRSPIRFHKAGKNTVVNNQWELATLETPPVRFNNTPESNITIESNEVLEPQVQIYLIGNSLTWDTVPSRLAESVDWHVDCGKSLPYIFDHSEAPCVGSSRIWPTALTSKRYDVISVQPHYGSSLEEDVDAISKWIELQPQAVWILHTGWARSATLVEEYESGSESPQMTHSPLYLDQLRDRLKEKFPEVEFRSTHCMRLLYELNQNIQQGGSNFESIEDVYRDAIHMTTGAGRYLMHNAMRETIGQERSDRGFEEIDPETKKELDALLDERASWPAAGPVVSDQK